MMKSILFAFMAGLGWQMAGRSDTTANGDPDTGRAPAQPVITSIRLVGTNVVVLAHVPAGITRVTLESCRRVGGEAWTPRAVSRLNKIGGEITFRLAQSADLEVLRIRADASESLPAVFYQGPTSFSPQPVSGTGMQSLGAEDAKSAGGGAISFNNGAAPASPDGQVPGRAVVESDIWKINGDTLYFFNQYRGLQVVDISQPDAPLVRGTLPLSAAGEQMYVLDETHVVLLARDGCNWGAGAESRALVVETAGGKPGIAASLLIPGTIQESRLIGTALYVASFGYREIPATNTAETGTWEWGTLISGFDLSQPNQPVARSTEWVSGSGSLIAATDRFLFVALAQTFDATAGPVIRIFDISAPDGTLARLSTVQPVGQVKDKFKMNLDGDVFTVVSEQWVGTQTTQVETFSLVNPRAPARLGSLTLTQGESLFATRFDGNRLYAVTFVRVDPLWVIDLSDPAQPKVAGEVQVPGWSTYIHPLGDRLVTIGQERTTGRRTTVSLFDVRDAAHPALLNRVALGEHDSTSEANLDEKALSVLPDAGLILVPFSSSGTNGLTQGVQLVDLSRDSLALRGRIEHPIEARRAIVHRDRILSLSGRELLSVDATDRNHPLVRSSTPLSWRVDQVFVTGQYLLEMDGAPGNSPGPQVRVASIGDPDQLWNQLTLTNLPFLGATLRGDFLYVAQGNSAQVNWEWFATERTNRPVSTNFGVFSLAVLDLSHLPAVTVAGQVQVSRADTVWGRWQALWPKPGLLVWKPSDYSWPYLGPLGPITLRMWTGDSINPWPGQLSFAPVGGFQGGVWRGGDVSTGVAYFAPWFGGGSPGRLMAFDVSDSSAPQLASDVNVGAPESGAGTSRGFAADGLVFLSHREFESRTTGTNYYSYTNTVIEIVTNVVTVTNVVRVPQYTTVTNYGTLTNIVPLAVLSRPFGAATEPWPDPATPPGSLAGGGYHLLLVGPKKTVWARGANEFGQLGEGTNSNANARIEMLPGFDGVKSLAAGYLHSLALKSDGTVWAWGGDPFGQVGDGVPLQLPGLPPLPDQGTTSPVQTPDLLDVVAVAAGGYHSLALRLDGRVWSWGANWYGQLGDGTTNDQHAPKIVSGLSDVRTLAGGGLHSLAVRTDGSVWGWGRNDFGQLGNDSIADSDEPVKVSGLRGASAVAAGSWHSLALKSDGSVWGWGNNGAGQLGGGIAAASSHPAPIPGLSDVIALSAGLEHNVALKSDGTVWAWGADDHGQLGDGTNVDRATPAAVHGLRNAVAVAAGGNFSLALTRDGTLWGWGDNSYGQLGDGQWYGVTNYVPYTNSTVVASYTTVTNSALATNYTKVARQVVTANALPLVEWFEHHYLDVVDYAVPTNPVVRTPVNVPGPLEGIAYDGALLYTVGQRAATVGGAAQSSWLDATAYDGVEAHLVDSLALPDQWPHPLLVHGASIFLGRPAPDTNSAPQIEAWTLPDTGRFLKLGRAALSEPAQNLAAFQDLIAVQNSNEVQLFDVSNPSAPTSIGSGGPGGCAGFNLEYADGSAARGLWLPLGDFGVHRVGPTNPPGSP